MKTNELTGVALDWAVNEAQGYNTTPPIVYAGCEGGDRNKPRKYLSTEGGFTIDYSNWSQGGPIIEREGIATRRWLETGWEADKWNFKFDERHMNGPTPLIAAMRCYVASKLGEEVEVPDDLISDHVDEIVSDILYKKGADMMTTQQLADAELWLTKNKLKMLEVLSGERAIYKLKEKL